MSSETLRRGGLVVVAFSVLALVTVGGCAGEAEAPTKPSSPPVATRSTMAPRAATIGVPFDFDAAGPGGVFTGGSNATLSYAVSFAPTANGLRAVQGRITGTPMSAGVVTATIVATDATGARATSDLPIAIFSDDLVAPNTSTAFRYSDASAPLPAHFLSGPEASIKVDNMPVTNATSDAGAALGRVLFYDRRLSVNDRASCATCHQQQFGFGDTARLSIGATGQRTTRRSMGLSNVRFSPRGRMFWDERAPSLEEQVLQPIANPVELSSNVPNALIKIAASSYYAPLFQAAFGSTEITSDRVARALAQFIRALVSSTSRYDQAFDASGVPDFASVMTEQERAGLQLFNGAAGCARCHATNSFSADMARNNGGGSAAASDVGSGFGRFRPPSLRNIAVRSPFMHDGRFNELGQVVEFYNSFVPDNPNLDSQMRTANGTPERLNLSLAQRAEIAAFLRTLTDEAFLTNPKFASPFAR